MQPRRAAWAPAWLPRGLEPGGRCPRGARGRGGTDYAGNLHAPDCATRATGRATRTGTRVERVKSTLLTRSVLVGPGGATAQGALSWYRPSVVSPREDHLDEVTSSLRASHLKRRLPPPPAQYDGILGREPPLAPAAVPTPAAAGGAAPLPLLSLVGKLAPQVHARARACVGERTKVASFLLHRHATLVLVRVPVVAVFARQLSLGRLHVELFGPCRLQSASSRPVPLWHFLTMAAARFKSRNLVDCAPAT